jgi:hypothetical protein
MKIRNANHPESESEKWKKSGTDSPTPGRVSLLVTPGTRHPEDKKTNPKSQPQIADSNPDLGSAIKVSGGYETAESSHNCRRLCEVSTEFHK